ncbi:DUF481 domain-containing protein [Parahaliea maris]|uniref:DUF481 domain-containing protein n=1 Tax=Parahaliea maris TaxID=2716870 RepID=A0A5C9A7R0_9GAMM|nr:DUF481 domain-containing protein [Parahaliea maris]TXS95261.1 DUF481 domain-containing protein [Parahaliea maris]
MLTFRTLCRVLCLCLLPATAAFADSGHQKTDVITLYNGDRITGEIKSMRQGLLQLSTDALGTVSIEWQEIARLDSKYNYQIRVTSGERFYGELKTGERPGEMAIVDLYGTHKLEYLEIVEVQPIEDRLQDRFEAYLSAGYSYTKASSVAQTTFNTDLSYEDQQSRNSLGARTTVTQTEEDDSQSSKIDLVRQEWSRDRASAFRGYYGNYESNDELGVDYRLSVGAGLGRFFIDTYQTRLTGGAGLQVLTEEGSEEGSRQSVEAFFAVGYDFWRFDSPEADVSLNFGLYPSLTESGRVRGSTDLRLRWEIISDLYWDITAYGSYDNQADTDRNTDYGVTTGLGWSY